MNKTQLYKGINLDDPRQDVHRERAHTANLNRYRVAEKLLPSDSNGLSVLELGGGIAELSRRMIARGIKVTFVDLSEHNVHKAQTLGLATYQIDLNAGLGPFADATFDGVIILEVIEHIVAAEFLLDEIQRVLKPGGFLILSTPNFAYFKNRLRILIGQLSHDEGYHYRFFTPRVLEKRLANAGLYIEQRAHTTPTIGYNLLFNRLLGKPRHHIYVPVTFASLFAHTLFVKAAKP